MKKLLALFSLPVLLASLSVTAYAQTTSNPNCVVLTTDMGVGATDATTGGQVTKLQNFLQLRGFLKQGLALGTYGQQTRSAVSSFQKNSGIIQTGYVGPLTRANIQTISCAIGSVDTSNLPTTVLAAGSQPLLTFVSPYAGDLVIKNEKDLGIDWTLTSGVLEAFPVANTSIILHLIDSTGAEIASFDTIKLSKGSNGNKVESDFKKAFREKRGTEVIPSGQYKVKATLRMKSSVTDQALIAKAATYASESGWFSIVDPAPKPDLKLSASANLLAVSVPVTLTWSSATGSVCTMYDGVATTTIASTGSKIVTPAQTTTYRVECSLTSAWPFTGSSYTTTVQKKEIITVGMTTSGNEVPTVTATTTTGVSRPSITVRANGSRVSNNETVKISNGSVLVEWGGTGAVSCTLNETPVPTSGSQIFTGITTSSYIYECMNSAGTTEFAFDVVLTTTAKAPTITLKANGSNVSNGSTIQAPDGAVTLEWGGVGATSCTLNGNTVPTSGAQIFRGLGTSSYTYTCFNFYGSKTLTFNVVATTGTVTGTLSAPTITIKANGSRVSNGETVKISNGSVLVEWGGTGAVSCTLNGTSVPTSGSQIFTGVTSSSYTYTCSNSAGTRTVQFSVQDSVSTSAPTITIKANGVRVYNGSTVNSSTGTVKFEWGSTGANSCTLNGEPFALSGAQTYTGLTSTTYTYTCSNSAGSKTIQFNVVVPAVLGVSSSCVDLAYNLHRGHESPNVTKLQAFLVSQGLLDETTGFYGDKTVAAVKTYQESKGLPMTGMVYGMTRAAIALDSCQ